MMIMFFFLFDYFIWFFEILLQSRGPESEPQPCHVTFLKIGHVIISTAFLSLQLIQEEQNVSYWESMHT